GADEQRENLFPVRFPPPGTEIGNVLELAVCARWTAGEIPKRRARKDDIRLNAARPGSLFAPGVQAIVSIEHVVIVANGARRDWGRSVEALLNRVQHGGP